MVISSILAVVVAVSLADGTVGIDTGEPGPPLEEVPIVEAPPKVASCEADSELADELNASLATCLTSNTTLKGQLAGLATDNETLRRKRAFVGEELETLRRIVRNRLGVTAPGDVKRELDSLDATRRDAEARAEQADAGLARAQAAQRSTSVRLKQAIKSVARIEERLARAKAANDGQAELEKRLEQQLQDAKSAVQEWQSRANRKEEELRQAGRTARKTEEDLRAQRSTQRRRQTRRLEELVRRAGDSRRRRHLRHVMDAALVLALAAIALIGSREVLRAVRAVSRHSESKRDEMERAARAHRAQGWKPSPAEQAAMIGWARAVVLTDAARDAVEHIVRASAVGAAGVVLLALGYLLWNGGGPDGFAALLDTSVWNVVVGFFGPPAAAIAAWATVQQRVRDFTELCRQLGLVAREEERIDARPD